MERLPPPSAEPPAPPAPEPPLASPRRDAQREMSAAVALLNSAPPAARARTGSAAPAPAYLADAILTVAAHQAPPPAPLSTPSSASSSARSVGSEALKSGSVTPPVAEAHAPAAPQTEDGEPFVDCLATINPTTVLMADPKRLEEFRDETGETDDYVPVRTAKILALKRHRVTREETERILRVLRYAFSRNYSRAEVHAVPRDDLQIFCENPREPFKTGDVQPRVGSKTWHIMRWLLHDEQTRCLLTREAVSKLIGAPEFRYALVADATSFERQDAGGTPAASELAGLRARVATLETQLRTRGDALASLEQALAARDERLKRAVAECAEAQRQLACYTDLSACTQRENERLLAESTALVAERDRLRDALRRAGLDADVVDAAAAP